MPEASVTVILVELEPDPNALSVQMMSASRPFFVYMASNPQIRADGCTEEEALENLKH